MATASEAPFKSSSGSVLKTSIGSLDVAEEASDNKTHSGPTEFRLLFCSGFSVATSEEVQSGQIGPRELRNWRSGLLSEVIHLPA